MEVEDTGAVALGDDLAVEGIVRARGAGGEVILDQAIGQQRPTVTGLRKSKRGEDRRKQAVSSPSFR